MQKTNRKITNTNPSLAAIILNLSIKHKGKDLQDGLKQKTQFNYVLSKKDTHQIQSEAKKDSLKVNGKNHIS